MTLCENQTDVSLVIRRDDTGECIGVAGLEGTHLPCPELGLWLKEVAHNQGYGREAVGALIEWASSVLGKEGFIYPVAEQNLPSRRIAEGLGGKLVGSRTSQKYEAVIYRIPCCIPRHSSDLPRDDSNTPCC